MENLKKSAAINASRENKTKTHANYPGNPQGSRNLDGQRVSVKDIIENHYRKVK